MKLIYWFIISLAICSVAIPVNAISDDDYITTTNIQGVVFNINQSVQGNGFVSELGKLRYGPVESMSLTHGSGYYKKDMNQYAQRDVYFSNRSDKYIATSLRTIKTNKNIEMVFSESDLKFPGSFKSGPFLSLWKEADLIHQNSYGFAMGLLIDNAKMAKKNLSNEVTGSSKVESYIPDSSFYDASLKSLADLDFDGRANIFQTVRFPGEKGKLEESMNKEDTYLGQMRIQHNIQLDLESTSKSPEIEIDSLPCCFGGYLDLPIVDRRYLTADGVFNCTCQSVDSIS
jgi:hypothetical protein